jgi:hypothetical protein
MECGVAARPTRSATALQPARSRLLAPVDIIQKSAGLTPGGFHFRFLVSETASQIISGASGYHTNQSRQQQRYSLAFTDSTVEVVFYSGALYFFARTRIDDPF